MHDPEDRIPMQEEIPERASSDGRHGCDDEDPEEIQPPATRREHATDREDGNAHQVEDMKHHTSSHTVEQRLIRKRHRLYRRRIIP